MHLHIPMTLQLQYYCIIQYYYIFPIVSAILFSYYTLDASPKASLTLINTYTDSGQLMCILCKLIVRSETVWPVHLNSKVHKENIISAKKTKLETENIMKTSNAPSFKRPSSPVQNTPVTKKIKGILKNSSQPVVQTKPSLPADFFDNNSKQSNDKSISTTQKQEKKDLTSVTTDVQSMEVEEEKEKVKDTNPAVLPEGFFDDPVMDAKVRLLSSKYNTAAY